MAALIHTLIVEDKYDKDFVQRYCHGWPTLSAYLCGDSDGLAKSADWAAGITGLNSAEIRSLAHEMASKRTFINLTYALQRQDHGEQPYWMAVALAAALGQIGLPGGGFAFPFGSAGSPGNGQPPKRIPSLPVPKRPADMPVISVSRIVDLLEAKAGERFECNGRNGAYPDTHMVYWAGGNIFHHHQDLNRLNRAWQRPETIVVHEPFWTSMAKRADIVLPATTPLERNDLGAAETMLLSMQAVLEPFGQARDDYAIFAELAKRLDFGATFTENRDADEWVEHLYEQFRTSNNFAPPYEEFRELGTLHHDMPPMGTPTQVFLSEFRADPQGKPLGTPSGLIELVSETIGAYGYADCPAHPSWLEPYERLGTDAALKHPLHLVSNQPIGRLHSQYDHGEASQQQKHKGREVCRLNPSEAAARGLQEADVVRIYNDRGACLAAVHITDAVMPGAIQLATGAWYDPDDKGMCKHGNPNVLTRDKGTSQLAQGPTAHTCLVEVERLDGEPPAITAFDPPAIVARNS